MRTDYSTTLERFAEVAYAALCEVGCGDIFVPAFLNGDGTPYLEFDTDDYPEDSEEFAYLIRAEQIAQTAVGYRTGRSES